MKQTTEPTWHHHSPQACLDDLHSDARQGLDPGEAEARLSRHGRNSLPQPRKRGPVRRFLAQFHNILLYIMLLASLVTLLLGHLLDSAVIFAAVLVNALIGFIQEGKAESALEGIRALLGQQANVIRQGQARLVAADSLVPGDIVLVASGDKVPADLRLLETRNLQIDEAALTGESLPVDKAIEAVERQAALGDRTGMAYSGTLVTQGQGRGVVVATGSQTEIGKINNLLSSVNAISTPLLRQIEHFGRRLALAILGMALLTFLFGFFWRGYPAADMFMMVVALAASAIPEGLPAIMTIMLAIGVQRMARQNAIVRRLPAVESLGSVTVICSDKTGTLTRNEMTVQQVVCSDQRVQVSGLGYGPEGGFSQAGRPLAELSLPLLQACRAAWHCNDARLRQVDGQWQVEGDPTEGALLALAAKAGLSGVDHSRRDSIPFESEHRFMATVQQDGTLFVKGAPERLLEMCSRQLGAAGNQPLDPDYWRRMATDLAAQGLRLLALARGTLTGAGNLQPDDLHDLEMLALVGIIDPPREEAIAAVAECHAAGIQVKMITGDHADTARAIGARLGLGIGKPALTGAEIALLDEQALRDVVAEVDIFARASPEHKLRLVQALQARGEVVAMTGDGVNDAPALKRADIGVAMGLKGTEAAKEAADMVLADDNFSTISQAVREGRAIYANLQKFILFMLPTNGGEALVVIAAILFQLSLPLTPAQVLWINMVTSCGLGLALALEPAERGLMQRPPRAPEASLLSGFFVWRVLLVSLLMMTGALGLFLWELEQGQSLEKARTMAVNAVVVAEMFYLLNSRYLYDSVINRRGMLGNPWVLPSIGVCLSLQLLFTYAPWLQHVFGSAALDASEWLKVIAAGLLVFFGAELEKAITRRYVRRRAGGVESARCSGRG